MVTPEFAHDAPASTSAADWRAHPEWLALMGMDIAAYDRVLVVAAHPDDESLGAGGLIARAHRQGVAVDLVLTTAGEHSHPGSPSVSPTELAQRRREESRTAWRALGPDSEPHFLGIEDGTVAESEEAMVTALVDLLGDARRVLVAAPWRNDGHPDHEAAGRATAAACRRTGADLVEYPVWFWHWGLPEQAPWEAMRAIELHPQDVALKSAAIAAHRTQVLPLSDAAGDEPLLGQAFLDMFHGAVEVFVRSPTADHALDDLHAEREEPWGAESRWYEQRKRDLALAVLPARRYRHALEVGCSTGVLTSELAARCEAVTALDSSPVAVSRAAKRLRGLPGAHAKVASVPAEWPEDTFDLIALSEVGYFLSPRDLDALAVRMQASLAPQGCVLLCHWQHPVTGWVLDGPQVHRRLVQELGLPVSARYVDRDVEILLLCESERLPDPTS